MPLLVLVPEIRDLFLIDAHQSKVFATGAKQLVVSLCLDMELRHLDVNFLDTFLCVANLIKVVFEMVHELFI